MDTSYLFEFIKPELLVLVPVLYFIGTALKRTAHVDDRWIPMILGLSGILLSLIWVVATGKIIAYQDIFMAFFTATVQGILISGASVYINQLIKQGSKE